MTLEVKNRLSDEPEKIHGYSVKESRDAQTGYRVYTYVPENGMFNGSCDIFFAGLNNTYQQAVDRMGLKELLKQKNLKGKMSAFSIVLGEGPSASDSVKYSKLAKKGAFASLVKSIETVTGRINTLNLSANSAGGRSLTLIADEVNNNNDSIACKIHSMMMGDGTYYNTESLAAFALKNSQCGIFVKYQDFNGSGTARWAKWLESQKKNNPTGFSNLTVDAEKRQSFSGDRHLGLAREGIFQVAGIDVNYASSPGDQARSTKEFFAKASNVGGSALSLLADMQWAAVGGRSLVAPKIKSTSQFIAFNGDNFKITFPTLNDYRENRLSNLIPPNIKELTNIRNKNGVVVSRSAYRRSEDEKFYDIETGRYIPVSNGYTGTIVPEKTNEVSANLPRS